MLSAVQELAVALTFPPTLSLCLLGCGILVWLLRWRRIGGGLMVFAFAWSLLWSIPWFSAQLRGSLARNNPVVAEAALPRADAIVVLGGGRYGNWMSRDSIDPDELKTSRLAAGARAWLAGRAPLIILSGGNGGGGRSEAEIMAAAIAKAGIPASALLLEEGSANTSDNARLTAALARKHGVRKVLLVTSTVHMPRASLLFRDAGIDVVPVPVPEGQLGKSWRERWLPSPYALWRSGRALKEYAALFAIHAQNFVDGHAEPVPTDSEM
jgi:uncharacterized SAM-binding protein YcdF (DUF218 family)